VKFRCLEMTDAQETATIEVSAHLPAPATLRQSGHPRKTPIRRDTVNGKALHLTDLVQAKERLGGYEVAPAQGRLVLRLPKRRGADLESLPPRLRQVRQLAAAGWTIKEAALRLGNGVKTAEVHRGSHGVEWARS
jgi:DNA-binding NarL/FixJ family response regulator